MLAPGGFPLRGLVAKVSSGRVGGYPRRMTNGRLLLRACAIAVCLSGSLGGCSASVSYAPTASLSQQEAVAVITRCLEEQPGGYAAMNVNVSSERLTFEKQHGSLVFGGSRPVATAFYFDTLGKMDITKKSKGSVVRVWDSSEVFRFLVVIPDPARARQFMDAMTSMAKARR